jgi:hypothetical protein
MRRLFLKSLITGCLGLLCVFGASFALLKYYDVEKPSNWSSDVILRSNPLRGNLRVDDASSNATLFYYSVDPAIQPIIIEKKDENTWVVTFKKREAIK